MIVVIWAAVLCPLAAPAFTPCYAKKEAVTMISTCFDLSSKSQLGGSCDRNFDCEHKGSICLRGRCRCHPHYIEVVDEKGHNPRCKRCNTINFLISI
uniref:EB domain-containing protein n=1 Tax=Parascaris equorum TaxID=6256 RepID=A0A914R9Q7_PAREQ